MVRFDRCDFTNAGGLSGSGVAAGERSELDKSPAWTPDNSGFFLSGLWSSLMSHVGAQSLCSTRQRHVVRTDCCATSRALSVDCDPLLAHNMQLNPVEADLYGSGQCLPESRQRKAQTSTRLMTHSADFPWQARAVRPGGNAASGLSSMTGSFGVPGLFFLGQGLAWDVAALSTALLASEQLAWATADARAGARARLCQQSDQDPLSETACASPSPSPDLSKGKAKRGDSQRPPVALRTCFARADVEYL